MSAIVAAADNLIIVSSGIVQMNERRMLLRSEMSTGEGWGQEQKQAGQEAVAGRHHGLYVRGVSTFRYQRCLLQQTPRTLRPWSFNFSLPTLPTTTDTTDFKSVEFQLRSYPIPDPLSFTKLLRLVRVAFLDSPTSGRRTKTARRDKKIVGKYSK